MSRKVIFAENEFYHLYNRGVDRRTVFENDSDHRRFALLLYLCNGKIPVRFEDLPDWKGSTSEELIEAVFGKKFDEPVVAIGAYCLMPNHFHLLVKEITKGGISTFMHRLSTAYTMYFNLSRRRTGALFQGRFKAEHADKDEYLKYLFSYIHLNPVKLIESEWKERGIKDLRKAEDYLASFPYSSHMDYLGTNRKFSKILNRLAFPDYFPRKGSFSRCINDWLRYKEVFPQRGKAQPYFRKVEPYPTS